MILSTYITCELSNNELWNLKKWEDKKKEKNEKDDNTNSDYYKHLNGIKCD